MLEKPEESSPVPASSPVSSLNTLQKVGFWRDLWQRGRLVYNLLLDPEVPVYLKLIPIATIGYIVFPFDLVPDIAIGLGQLDDLTVLFLGTKAFIDLAPPAVVAKHMEAIREQDAAVAGLLPRAHQGDDDLKNAIVINADREVIVEKQPEDLEK